MSIKLVWVQAPYYISGMTDLWQELMEGFPEIHVNSNLTRCHRKEGEKAEQGEWAGENTGWEARLAFLTGSVKT